MNNFCHNWQVHCNFRDVTIYTLAIDITGVVMADKFHELLQFLKVLVNEMYGFMSHRYWYSTT